MVLLDNETTALIRNGLIPLDQQPEIIEFGAVKLDDKTLKEVGSLRFLLKPRILPLAPEVTKITGLTTDDVKNQKPFVAHYREIADFFLGERTLVAHNAPFDAGMLELELRRIGKLIRFPWPIEHICTSERNTDKTNGKYVHLYVLYEMVTGEKITQTHRADDDARLLVPIVKWMRKAKKL